MSKGAMVNAADTIFASQASHLARRPWAQADEGKVAGMFYAGGKIVTQGVPIAADA